MILEAFAAYLHQADPRIPATEVLAAWLAEKLSRDPRDNVDRVLHCEMSMRVSPEKSNSGKERARATFKDSCLFSKMRTELIFQGKSKSGRQLLRSLYEYCQSYDQQKWSRFVHTLKASDFNPDSNKRSVGN